MAIMERESKMRLLLLSNINMRPLVSRLAPWEVACGSYNSMLGDLATTTSAAAAPEISHVICTFDTDALMGEALYGVGAADQCDLFLVALDAFCERHPDKVVVTNAFCAGSNRWLGFADFHHEASLKNLEMQLNAKLAVPTSAEGDTEDWDFARGREQEQCLGRRRSVREEQYDGP
jgi:hypothetical protein